MEDKSTVAKDINEHPTVVFTITTETEAADISSILVSKSTARGKQQRVRSPCDKKIIASVHIQKASIVDPESLKPM
jgi:hypothetical protein